MGSRTHLVESQNTLSQSVTSTVSPPPLGSSEALSISVADYS